MIYNYSATKKTGKITHGEIKADSRDEVIRYLQAQGLTPLSIESSKNKQSDLFTPNISKIELIVFTRHLSTLLSAGVPMLEAIKVLGDDASNKTLKKILTQALYDLENGHTLSHTFLKYPKIFSKIYINLIKTGEKSGTLNETLSYLTVQLEKEHSLTSKVKNALAYPAILIVGSILLLIMMFTFVIPRLQSIFNSSNVELPWTTKTILFVGNIFSASPIATVIITIVVFVLLVILFKTNTGRNAAMAIFGKMPIAQELIRKINVARFARTMSILIKSGVPIIRAIDITSDNLDNKYRKALLSVKKDVAKGVSLSNAMAQKKKLFPSILISMIGTGEKSGETDKLLIQIAKFYESEVNATLKNLVSLVEPILLLIIGGLILVLALSVVTPVYNLVTNIG